MFQECSGATRFILPWVIQFVFFIKIILSVAFTQLKFHLGSFFLATNVILSYNVNLFKHCQCSHPNTEFSSHNLQKVRVERNIYIASYRPMTKTNIFVLLFERIRKTDSLYILFSVSSSSYTQALLR